MLSRKTRESINSLIESGYRYACALQPDAGEARGLVHEAWIRVSQNHGARPDKALLYKAIRNLYIDQYRRGQKVRFTAFDDNGLEAAEHMGDIDVAELPDAQLQRALLQLRDKEREVLFLSVVEGYTAEEISTLTDSPRGSVLSLVHRARLKLRTAMVTSNVSALSKGQEGEAS